MMAHQADTDHRRVGGERLAPMQHETGNTPLPLAALEGTAGDDRLEGTAGSDDLLSGLGGNDTLLGGAIGDPLGFGYASDTLRGGDGDDFLVDAMYRNVDATRPHTFFIDGGDGVDHASIALQFSSVRFALADNLDAVVGLGYFTAITGVERVSIVASRYADSLTGGALDDALHGSAGRDTLAGWGGNDNLDGGDGADALRGGQGGDLVDGGRGADALRGGDGADTLRGAGGNDTLHGGHDGDVFLLDTPPAPGNADTVADFEPGLDRLQLDRTAFVGLGAGTTVADAQFHAAPGAVAAHDADDRLIYDTSSGRLYYDADGSADGYAARPLATLADQPALGADSFAIVG